ncbi:Uncharacterized protein DAT39_006670 [Clarias magur]|uniref:Uncharacterized protein n=1 Tax=Clarias magur TaxID=1594786 RepID=A0A8J4X6I7_CLAMG|nr:Uncharacterized protein DAT39_006670 [Clarias magur]
MDILQEVLRSTRAVQRLYLARLRQQRPQPGHLHHVQHRVPTSLHQDPELLIPRLCNPSGTDAGRVPRGFLVWCFLLHVCRNCSESIQAVFDEGNDCQGHHGG